MCLDYLPSPPSRALCSGFQPGERYPPPILSNPLSSCLNPIGFQCLCYGGWFHIIHPICGPHISAQPLQPCPARLHDIAGNQRRQMVCNKLDKLGGKQDERATLTAEEGQRGRVVLGCIRWWAHGVRGKGEMEEMVKSRERRKESGNKMKYGSEYEGK